MVGYPTAAGYTVVVRQDGTPQYECDSNTATVGVQMHGEAGPRYPVPEEVRSQRLDAVLTPYLEGGYWIFPATIAGKRPLHPMMAWCAVLYALSMLARYQPAEWASCIDINGSPYANSVEYLLEEARAAVPDLVLTNPESDRGQLITSRPPSTHPLGSGPGPGPPRRTDRNRRDQR